MTFDFNLDQMIKALTKIGYVIKEETVMVNKPMVGNSDREEAHKVYNVYLHGEPMVSWGALGTYRVEFVFKQELEKRLLALF